MSTSSIRIAITNRHLCEVPLITQLETILPKIDMLILREKDMSPEEYTELARDVIKLCKAEDTLCVLHSFTETARKLNHMHIHLPMPLLREQSGKLDDFISIGASVHSEDEAREACELSASYLIASHIFPTDCKPGLAPKGLALISNICANTNIPVYGLGGINDSNETLVLSHGASGICRMSDYMKQ